MYKYCYEETSALCMLYTRRGPCSVVKAVLSVECRLCYVHMRCGMTLMCVHCSELCPLVFGASLLPFHYSSLFVLVSTARKPVTATSDVQLSAMRSRIAELKAQLKGGGDRDSAAMGSLGVSCAWEGWEEEGSCAVDLNNG